MFGPFLAALYDSIFRGLRDAPGSWREHFRRSWKQNAKASLLPGTLVGLLVGMYAFMLYMMWVAQTPPTLGTVAVVLFGALLFFAFNLLYWPQLVLFQQSAGARLYNAVLFTLKYFWRVMGAAALLLLWTLLLRAISELLVPFLGLWFILLSASLPSTAAWTAPSTSRRSSAPWRATPGGRAMRTRRDALFFLRAKNARSLWPRGFVLPARHTPCKAPCAGFALTAPGKACYIHLRRETEKEPF